MTLTPSSLRLDLKCGKGAISEGEKCTKGAATRVSRMKEKSVRAQRVVNTLGVGLGVVGVAALGAWGVRAIKQERDTRRWYRAQERAERAHWEQVRQNQQRIIRNNEDFMRGFRSPQSPQRANQPSRPYNPPKGSREAKVQTAFTTPVPYITQPHSSPNPDVSAAWKRVAVPNKPSKYKNDPDLSGVWAAGFKP